MKVKLIASLIISIVIMAVAIPFSYAGQATILTDEELDQVSAKGMPEIFWEILPIGSGDLGDYLTMLSQSSSGSYSLGTAIRSLPWAARPSRTCRPWQT